MVIVNRNKFTLKIVSLFFLLILVVACGERKEVSSLYGFQDFLNDILSPSVVYMWSDTTLRNGNLGGLRGADTLCKNNAPVSLSGKTHLPILSTSLSSPKNYFISNPEVRRSDKTTVIANSYSDFFSGAVNISTPIFAISATYWTGLDGSGDASTDNCNDWTSATTDHRGTQGNGSFRNSGRINATVDTCDFRHQLLCVSF